MRIAILGNSGSGKSTLAKRLAAENALPVLDLDRVAWMPGQVAVARPIEEALREVRQFCSGNAGWIVEGCYAQLIAATLEFVPTLILLDPGVERCVANCRDRPWEPEKYPSKAEQDARLEFLIDWVRDYYKRDGDMSYTAHVALFERYAGPKEWRRGAA